MKKQYQTIGAQITNIVKNKNVLKSTIIKDSFYEKSYINLITPYSELLAKGRNDKDKHIYDFNRDFSEYIDCNKIDNAICHKLHNYIGVFEKRLKNFLAHKYCSKMKSNGDKQAKDYSWISDYKNRRQVFDFIKYDKEYSSDGSIIAVTPGTRKRRKEVLDVIKHTSDIKNNSQKAVINHYKDKYGFVPMFIVIHTLTLGKLITLFSMLSQSDKHEFIIDFIQGKRKFSTNAQIFKFERMLNRINVIRNIINHYESIIPFILSTEQHTYADLLNLLERLKNNFSRSCLEPENICEIPNIPIERNDYNKHNIQKLEKVINKIK